MQVWNDLPVHIVKITWVKPVHSKLTQCVRKACEDNAEGGASMYSTDKFPNLMNLRYCGLYVNDVAVLAQAERHARGVLFHSEYSHLSLQ